MVFTASHVMLQVLVDSGVTHAFVNLGSDHPSLLEAFIERKQRGSNSLEVITCPNEMVALSAAQGYAQLTGKPAAVIVHVDCGTQALAGAVHNVSTCRTPVFIYAGASPFTQHGELAGSRNEFIHYLQNAVDQPAIVRQYMRHTAEIRTGKNIQQVILRSLQYANSEPKGPVYCWAPREVTEELLDPDEVPNVRVAEHWSPLEEAPLNHKAVSQITTALLGAKTPLIVTSYVGRNPAAVKELAKLADLLAIPVFSSCPGTVNIPFDHPSHAGVAYGGKNELVESADVILILDSDVPWVPLVNTLRGDATVFHIDCDPLKDRMAMHAFPSSLRCRADAAIALSQLTESITTAVLPSIVETRRMGLLRAQKERQASFAALEEPAPSGLLSAPSIIAALRDRSPVNTLVLNEAISNYPHVWNHFAPKSSGSLLTSGASSLGWALGAALGASFAGHVDAALKKDLIAVVVGDGSFIFGVPSASYWIARRYQVPFLTIVLNNGGWKSPRLSMLGVHPTGLGSASSAADLNISFGPDDSLNPDYGGIAAASGGAWTKKIKIHAEIDEAMKEAIRVVVEEKRCALLDCWLERF